MTAALVLAPCPFCACTNLEMNWHPGWRIFGFVLQQPSAFVWCNGCDTACPSAKTQEVAARWWNVRHPLKTEVPA